MSQSPKIVIVEDDTDIRFLYQFKLEAEGYEVATATDGQEGFDTVEQFRPDLVLLDLRMPVMSGEAMLQKLRETEWGATMRVIILTNISRNEAPPALRFLNVDRYAVKAHHTPKQIAEMVQEVLGI